MKKLQLILERGIKHLLIDQPSVDKEFDEGLLLAQGFLGLSFFH